ncbi:hypothetical protein JCM21900_005753 [Sporobolomyces salmonicolor]
MITTFLLRDLTLASLPDSYADVILPALTSTTSWDNLKMLVTNFWNSHTSWEEIQQMEEARQVVTQLSMQDDCL